MKDFTLVEIALTFLANNLDQAECDHDVTFDRVRLEEILKRVHGDDYELQD